MDSLTAMKYGHAVATKVGGRYDDDFLSVANEATTNALRKFKADPQGPDAKGLIGAYVRRAVQTFKRAAMRRREVPIEAAIATASYEDGPSLADFVERLPEGPRELAQAVMIEGRSCRSLARERDTSPTTVCDELKRARHMLRAMYEDHVYAGT